MAGEKELAEVGEIVGEKERVEVEIVGERVGERMGELVGEKEEGEKVWMVGACGRVVGRSEWVWLG